jgi:hypothetical protein
MPLPPDLLARLEGQIEALDRALRGISKEALERRTPAGEWSAHENVAHLARHADVFGARVRTILDERRPALPRYRAEDDVDWPAWAALATVEAVRRLREGRRELLALLGGLDDEALARTAVHPSFGEMPLGGWLEFLLLHEAHHLYVAFKRARGAD